MGRGVGREAKAPAQCGTECVVAEVGALVGKRCGEAAASGGAGCTAEPDGVRWRRGGEKGRVKMRTCVELKVGLEMAERDVRAKLVWWGERTGGVGGRGSAWAKCCNAVRGKVVVKSVFECCVYAVEQERVGCRYAAGNCCTQGGPVFDERGCAGEDTRTGGEREFQPRVACGEA